METNLICPPLDPTLEAEWHRNISLALAEDHAAEDASAALIDPAAHWRAHLIVREPARLCGALWFEGVMAALGVEAITWQFREGEDMAANATVCEVRGQAWRLLAAERSAINFLQMYSGIASLTAAYVAQVAAVNSGRTWVMETRKTIPGHRLAQKYAVRVGGGHNQRLHLADGVLIKENHIAAAGGVSAAWQRAQGLYGKQGLSIQIEVETLTQLEEALAAGAQLVLLDNFSLELMNQAVAINRGRAALEVSGGVNLDGVAAIAATGVDRISIGRLTKDIRATDFSLRFLTSF